MMSVSNRASEVTAIVEGRDEANEPIMSVLAKRTYRINPGKRVTRAETAKPFVRIDEYYDDGEPEWTTVKHEAEFAAYKIATDVIVIGKAYAPYGNPVPLADVTVQVGSYRKILRVTGNRHCIYRPNANPLFSDPVPFSEMPIQYDRAYGGHDLLSDTAAPFYYPRNDRGIGVVLKNAKETVDNLVLPNIEDPADLLTPDRVVFEKPDNWSRQPLPDGLGWFDRTWYPRCSLTGAIPSYLDIESVLREEALGLIPKGQVALSRQFRLPGFDVRFNNGASRGLILPYLKGDESFKLTKLTPGCALEFQLPGETPSMMLDIGFGEKNLKPIIHTVCVRLEEMQVDIIWRGAHPYPGLEWLPEMKKMVAEVH
jgi:hypothetical protein